MLVKLVPKCSSFSACSYFFMPTLSIYATFLLKRNSRLVEKNTCVLIYVYVCGCLCVHVSLCVCVHMCEDTREGQKKDSLQLDLQMGCEHLLVQGTKLIPYARAASALSH